MRVTLKVDGATPAQVHRLTRAFVRNVDREEMPKQITDLPVVGIDGVAMTWQSPALRVTQAAGLLDGFIEIDTAEISTDVEKTDPEEWW